MNKPKLIDTLFIIGYAVYILYCGYHLRVMPDKFNASDFGQGLMFILFGHGGTKAVGAADTYFNTPDTGTDK